MSFEQMPKNMDTWGPAYRYTQGQSLMKRYRAMRWTTVLFLCALGVAAQAQALVTDAQSAAAAGEYSAAVALWQEHLEGSPDDGSAHYQLANAAFADGRYALAQEHYLSAAKLGFQAQGAQWRLARIDMRMDRPQKALEKIRELGEAGFPMPQLVADEADFAPIAGEPVFATAVEAMTAARFPCKSSADHRAFDFWIGDWDVSMNGTPAGENHVYPILEGCVLFENWTSASGSTGKSFNFYDRAEGLWKQVWIDDRGGVLEFSGEMRDGNLHYSAKTTGTDGSITLHNLVFTPNEDGSVRQFWTQSTDDGESWQTAFDGHYVKKAQ